jgi:hypothetical protein
VWSEDNGDIWTLTHSTVQDIICKAECHSACQKISYFLVEPVGSLPCSQKPVTGLYPEQSEPGYSKKNLPLCHLVLSKSRMDCLGIEPELPWCKAAVCSWVKSLRYTAGLLAREVRPLRDPCCHKKSQKNPETPSGFGTLHHGINIGIFCAPKSRSAVDSALKLKLVSLCALLILPSQHFVIFRFF